MKNKNGLKDELRAISPLLSRLKEGKEGYQVPNDYFKSLPDEVWQKVAPEQAEAVEPTYSRQSRLTTFLQNFFRPKYALALASVALLLVAGFYFMNNENAATLPPAVALEEISDEALDTYINDNIEDFDEALLEEQLAGKIGGPLPGLDLENSEGYYDEIIDELDIEDIEDLL
ncbi:MAG TPA: hypothetical protein ENJ95_19830 [Bacteroidetes bacterium]|nr:hypothetical protein [Bacteroidota bacterium]